MPDPNTGAWSAHGLAPLQPAELVQLSGGTTAGGPIGKFLEALLNAAAECLVNDWNHLVDCFNAGREAAKT